MVVPLVLISPSTFSHFWSMQSNQDFFGGVFVIYPLIALKIMSEHILSYKFWKCTLLFEIFTIPWICRGYVIAWVFATDSAADITAAKAPADVPAHAAAIAYASVTLKLPFSP